MNHSISRRSMLQTAACGFGYLALTDLMARAAAAEQAPAGAEAQHYESPLKAKAPHFAAKAKRVIFLFMQGAPSHVDTFDYKLPWIGVPTGPYNFWFELVTPSLLDQACDPRNFRSMGFVF